MHIATRRPQRQHPNPKPGIKQKMHVFVRKWSAGGAAGPIPIIIIDAISSGCRFHQIALKLDPGCCLTRRAKRATKYIGKIIEEHISASAGPGGNIRIPNPESKENACFVRKRRAGGMVSYLLTPPPSKK